MLTLQKVKPQYPIYVYISNHCFVQTHRVTVSETVVMPPQSEIVVNGKVNDRFPILFKVGLVEPTDDFRKSDKALGLHHPWQKYVKMSAKDVLLLNPVPGTDPGLIAQTNLLNRVKEPPRRVPYHLQGEYDTAIQDMLNKNVIEPPTSPWASGVVLVKKKDGSPRQSTLAVQPWLGHYISQTALPEIDKDLSW
jgi:hypothetical protein